MAGHWKLKLIMGLSFWWVNCVVYGSSVDTESAPALLQSTGVGERGSSVDTESAPALLQSIGGGGRGSSVDSESAPALLQPSGGGGRESSVDTESTPALLQSTGGGGRGSSVDTGSAPAQPTGDGGPHSSSDTVVRTLDLRLNKQPSEEKHPTSIAEGPLPHDFLQGRAAPDDVNPDGDLLRTESVEWMEPLDRDGMGVLKNVLNGMTNTEGPPLKILEDPKVVGKKSIVTEEQKRTAEAMKETFEAAIETVEKKNTIKEETKSKKRDLKEQEKEAKKAHEEAMANYRKIKEAKLRKAESIIKRMIDVANEDNLKKVKLLKKLKSNRPLKEIEEKQYKKKSRYKNVIESVKRNILGPLQNSIRGSKGFIDGFLRRVLG